MPQALRQSIKFKNFSMPVSYNTDQVGKMSDARNVFTNRNRLDTRHGVQRAHTYAVGSIGFNLDVSKLDINKFDSGVVGDESLLDDIISTSFFKKTDGTKYEIVKQGITLWAIDSTGNQAVLKTGLTATTKHRSETVNDRAIIVIEEDGLYAYDGTTFSILGQDSSDTAVSVAASGSGNTLTAKDYKVAFTYYASSIGFESNLSLASSTVTVASGEQIDVTNIPTTALNEFIDKKRIYIKDVTNEGEWLFYSEINLNVSTETIDEDTTSSITPPTKNARPFGANAKFIAKFGSKIAIAGVNGFESDVLFSEPFIPDAFDDSTSTRLVFKASGNGDITGIKTGYYTTDNLSPYLCVFKKRSIEVYSNLSGTNTYSVISSGLGCVNQDTIREINGDIYFMSEGGFHIISNGRIVTKNDKAFKLGDSDIDSIFTEEGFTYELNKANFGSFFSVYYQTLNQYMVFTSESGNTLINKSYNYEFDINGFRPYDYALNFYCSCSSEDENNDEIVLLGGKNGRLYKHSINVTKHDVDIDNNSVDIDAFAQLYWIAHDDFDASMNFGTMIFKAITQVTPITVKAWLNYHLSEEVLTTYDFNDNEGGFILDQSKLDINVLSDGRTIVKTLSSGIYKTAKSLMIGFYQSGQDINIGLLSGQIDASKNANNN